MSGYPGGLPAGVHTATPVQFPPHNPANIHVPGGPPPGPPAGPPGGAAVPDSYFTESKKGEVNELRNLLRNFGTERDPQRKRDIIKKVIAYMTLVCRAGAALSFVVRRWLTDCLLFRLPCTKGY